VASLISRERRLEKKTTC